ncbi:MAG TPA: E3 binding domain-containing protein, partial [Prolixibacteraceae bacterium]
MAIPVLMPRQGQSVETCILGEWVKEKGDTVKIGDILFSYETDKASFEEDAKADGILLEVFFAEGDEVPVLVNVAVIGAIGESVDEFRPGSQISAPSQETPTTVVAAERVSAPEIKMNFESSGKIKITPRAKHAAERMGVAYQQLKGSGPEGRIIERDVEDAAQMMPKLTPLAQEKTKAEGLKTGETATGLGGKAVADDLISYNQIYSDDFEVKKLTNMRKLIAKAMLTSLQNSAQL